MKTAISIDDKLLQASDKAAKRMGVSRSRFFSIAANELLRKQREDEITRRLNEVWADGMDNEEKQVLDGMLHEFSRTIKDPW